jgi:hypothetical protein
MSAGLRLVAIRRCNAADQTAAGSEPPTIRTIRIVEADPAFQKKGIRNEWPSAGFALQTIRTIRIVDGRSSYPLSPIGDNCGNVCLGDF